MVVNRLLLIQKQFCLIFSFLLVIGLGQAFSATSYPLTSGLLHKYSIYFFSEDDLDNELEGSYLHFQLKAGVGATYEYYIKNSQHITGRVTYYNEREGEREYILEGFFNDFAQARLRIIDMPNCDNMKVAVIYYANEKEDPSETYLQYILVNEGFVPNSPITNIK